jgi:hypothetical protein
MFLCACLALKGERMRRPFPAWSSPYAELGKVVEQSKNVQEPYDEHDHHNSIQDALDLTLHRNEAIDQPKQDAYNADRENNSHKWHLALSI